MVERATGGLLTELLRAPNLLSLARIPLGALVWVAPASVPWMFTLLALAAVTDLLDGVLARRLYKPGEEHIGTWLDPLCDKVFVALATAAVWLALGPPVWLGLVALTREWLVLCFMLVRLVTPSLRSRVIPWRALLAGKATTVAQFALFGAVLLELRATWPWLAVAAGVLGVVAAVQYLVRLLRALRAESPLPGGER